MVREIAIAVYLFIFRIIFNLFKLLPLKQKTVGVTSFGDNIFYTAKAVRSHNNQEEIIILQNNKRSYPMDSAIYHIITFSILHPIAYLISIYHLATAKTILVDNYYGFLAVTNFKQEATCIQLWHAAGAIKQFGILDRNNKNRSNNALKRFEKVYKKFNYVVVGSEKMATIFRKSFKLPSESIIRTGVPRTDIFFDLRKKREVKASFKAQYPNIRNRSAILYAPTFRDDKLDNYRLHLDIEKLSQELSNDYVLLIKLHPAVSYSLNEEYKDFVIDVSHWHDTNALLLNTDLLITDYSSIPFEYALLEKPMIFFAYDLDDYRSSRGLIENYVEQMPGPVVNSTEDIIACINENQFPNGKIAQFSKTWNEYSKGHSSDNLALFITSLEDREKKRVYL